MSYATAFCERPVVNRQRSPALYACEFGSHIMPASRECGRIPTPMTTAICTARLVSPPLRVRPRTLPTAMYRTNKNLLLRVAMASATCIVLHTASVAQCCDHHLVMHDSYGDGWNGGFLEVRLNGTSIGTYAATGYGSGSTITRGNGGELELE